MPPRLKRIETWLTFVLMVLAAFQATDYAKTLPPWAGAGMLALIAGLQWLAADSSVAKAAAALPPAKIDKGADDAQG
jgi:hypothetical protein